MGISTTNGRPYQPINSYGVIGNCHTAVLIAPDGAIDWGCFPDFDSPAIFCRLLDAQRGGYFQIAPADATIAGSQRYLDGSNVLQTTFTGQTGTIRLTDFMPVETLSAWSYRAMNNNTWTREDGSCHCLVRNVACTEGEVSITMTLKVTPHYAASACEIALTSDGTGAVLSGGDQHIGLAVVGTECIADFALECLQDNLNDTTASSLVVARIILREGERITFALGVGRSSQAAHRLVEYELLQHNFDWELAHTLSCWRKWLTDCSYQGSYRQLIQRSALVLKLLSYSPTGAIVAAPTTSLPESDGGERNWDYRFTWLRDASFTLQALSQLDFTEEARAFMRWLLRLSYTNGEDLQIMYGIRGERELPEQELTHLNGYQDARPVRIGNEAALQKQHDVLGEILDCIYLYWCRGSFERYGEQPDGPLWSLMRLLIEYVCAHWQEVDSGIWEIRGFLSHFVYSKVMCWVALDRGIRAAQQFHLEADLPRWCMIRDQIRVDILSHGYNTKLQAFTQRYNDTALDASNLLLPLVGFIAPDDPRMLSTVNRTIKQLTDERGFVYRYRTSDGLSGDEGTFLICTCWLIDNLSLQGRLAEARSLFERVLACAGPLGLFSEEVAPGSNAALGNYPQALTHIGLINSALHLSNAETNATGNRTA